MSPRWQPDHVFRPAFRRTNFRTLFMVSASSQLRKFLKSSSIVSFEFSCAFTLIAPAVPQALAAGACRPGNVALQAE